MAKQRMVLTSIWQRSRKFRACGRDAKYLYLYLITNDDTELCGAYEQTVADICHFTGLSGPEFTIAISELAAEKLAFYHDGWVIIPKYLEKQNVGNPKVKKGVEYSLSLLPEWVCDVLKGFPIDRLSIGYAVPITDSDSDSDDKTTTLTGSSAKNDAFESAADDAFEPATVPATAGEPKALAPLKDPLARQLDEAFRAVHDYVSIAKERGQITRLTKLCKARDPTHPTDVAQRMLKAFAWLRENAEPFWRKQPFTPSALSSLWDRVEAEIEARMETQLMSDRARAFLEATG